MTEPAPQPDRPAQPGRARIFLNYRRDDTGVQVGRLEEALGRHLDPGQVFRDRSGITGGERWKERLRDEVAASSVFLCIIGKGWLDARDPESKKRRIDDEDDWVRVEIEEALRRASDGLLFLPVLVDGAALPRPEHLPESLRGLCEHEAVTLRTDDWDSDFPKLLKHLVDAGAEPLRSRPVPAPIKDEEEGELSKLYRALADAKTKGRNNEAKDLERRICSIKKEQLQGPYLEPGRVFGGRFELRERLGQGGFGEVWRAYDNKARGSAAVKFLYPHLARNLEHRSRFDRGARTMQRLTHPRIVRVLTLTESEEDWFWYAMEYVPGGNLREAVADPAFSTEQGVAVVEDVAKALDHAYETDGLVHRDIKPANILIDAQGRGKLTDFDLVKDPTSTQLTRAVGDFDFGPPEILRGRDACRESDVYSLAMTLIFCLSRGRVVGREGETIETLSPFIGCTAQCEVLKSALSSDPTKRPSSCLVLMEDWKSEIVGQALSGVEPDWKGVAMPTALAAIVQQCLRPDSSERPQDALQLANRLSTFLAAKDDVATVRRKPVASKVSRPRRRLTPLLVLLLVAVGAGLFGWDQVASSFDPKDEEPSISSDGETTHHESTGGTSETPSPAKASPDTAELRKRLEQARGLMDDPSTVAASVTALAQLVELEAGGDTYVAEALAEAKKRQAKIPDWATPVAGGTFDPKTGLPTTVLHEASQIELVLIPAGSYLRGAPESDDMAHSEERPQHRVTISEPFYLGKYEVTNAQFRLYQGDHDSREYDGLSLNGEDQPAAFVSWDEAKAFCDRFGFLLPTEAQWEYACRAGTTTRFPWGDDPDDGAGWANCADQTAKSKYPGWTTFSWEDGYIVTSPVGAFRANAFGLYDMIGNVWEWCSDRWKSSEYERHADGVTDPQGPVDGTGRLLRGGSWNFIPRHCRSSVRDHDDPAREYDVVGFRVSRAP